MSLVSVSDLRDGLSDTVNLLATYQKKYDDAINILLQRLNSIQTLHFSDIYDINKIIQSLELLSSDLNRRYGRSLKQLNNQLVLLQTGKINIVNTRTLVNKLLKLRDGLGKGYLGRDFKNIIETYDVIISRMERSIRRHNKINRRKINVIVDSFQTPIATIPNRHAPLRQQQNATRRRRRKEEEEEKDATTDTTTEFGDVTTRVMTSEEINDLSVNIASMQQSINALRSELYRVTHEIDLNYKHEDEIDESEDEIHIDEPDWEWEHFEGDNNQDINDVDVNMHDSLSSLNESHPTHENNELITALDVSSRYLHICEKLSTIIDKLDGNGQIPTLQGDELKNIHLTLHDIEDVIHDKLGNMEIQIDALGLSQINKRLRQIEDSVSELQHDQDNDDLLSYVRSGIKEEIEKQLKVIINKYIEEFKNMEHSDNPIIVKLQTDLMSSINDLINMELMRSENLVNALRYPMEQIREEEMASFTDFIKTITGEFNEYIKTLQKTNADLIESREQRLAKSEDVIKQNTEQLKHVTNKIQTLETLMRNMKSTSEANIEIMQSNEAAMQASTEALKNCVTTIKNNEKVMKLIDLKHNKILQENESVIAKNIMALGSNEAFLKQATAQMSKNADSAQYTQAQLDDHTARMKTHSILLEKNSKALEGMNEVLIDNNTKLQEINQFLGKNGNSMMKILEKMKENKEDMRKINQKIDETKQVIEQSNKEHSDVTNREIDRLSTQFGEFSSHIGTGVEKLVVDVNKIITHNMRPELEEFFKKYDENEKLMESFRKRIEGNVKRKRQVEEEERDIVEQIKKKMAATDEQVQTVQAKISEMKTIIQQNTDTISRNSTVVQNNKDAVIANTEALQLNRVTMDSTAKLFEGRTAQWDARMQDVATAVYESANRNTEASNRISQIHEENRKVLLEIEQAMAADRTRLLQHELTVSEAKRIINDLLDKNKELTDAHLRIIQSNEEKLKETIDVIEKNEKALNANNERLLLNSEQMLEARADITAIASRTEDTLRRHERKMNIFESKIKAYDELLKDYYKEFKSSKGTMEQLVTNMNAAMTKLTDTLTTSFKMEVSAYMNRLDLDESIKQLVTSNIGAIGHQIQTKIKELESQNNNIETALKKAYEKTTQLNQEHLVAVKNEFLQYREQTSQLYTDFQKNVSGLSQAFYDKMGERERDIQVALEKIRTSEFNIQSLLDGTTSRQSELQAASDINRTLKQSFEVFSDTQLKTMHEFFTKYETMYSGLVKKYDMLFSKIHATEASIESMKSTMLKTKNAIEVSVANKDSLEKYIREEIQDNYKKLEDYISSQLLSASGPVATATPPPTHLPPDFVHKSLDEYQKNHNLSLKTYHLINAQKRELEQLKAKLKNVITKKQAAGMTETLKAEMKNLRELIQDKMQSAVPVKRRKIAEE